MLKINLFKPHYFIYKQERPLGQTTGRSVSSLEQGSQVPSEWPSRFTQRRAPVALGRGAAAVARMASSSSLPRLFVPVHRAHHEHEAAMFDVRSFFALVLQPAVSRIKFWSFLLFSYLVCAGQMILWCWGGLRWWCCLLRRGLGLGWREFHIRF